MEDYAFLIQGLVDLYETSFDVKWLVWAVRLQEQQDALFWDDRSGGYFATREGAEHVLVRMKDNYDGPEPSANSVAAMNLLRLWQVTDREVWRDKADATFTAFADRLGSQGTAVPQLGAALDFSLSKPKQVVIAGEPGAADTKAMLRLVHARFIPIKFCCWRMAPAARNSSPGCCRSSAASPAGTARRPHISARTMCASCRRRFWHRGPTLDGTWNPDSKR